MTPAEVEQGTAVALEAPPAALLALLCCPVTRGPLALDAEAGVLVSARAGLAFPVIAGVPVLLADAGRPWPTAGEKSLSRARP